MPCEVEIVLAIRDCRDVLDPVEHRLPLTVRELKQMVLSDPEQFERAYGREGLRLARNFAFGENHE